MGNTMINIGDFFKTNSGCEVEVIKYEGANKVTVEFKDAHKCRVVTKSSHLYRGVLKNPYQPSVLGVGYMGVGRHKSSIGSKPNPIYSIWQRMIIRCYRPLYLNKNAAYRDCFVCENWHNFQNFANWAESNQYYNEDFQLDKDILAGKSKIYSPETCVFVPQLINTILVFENERTGKYPIGVSFSKDSGLFSVKVRLENGKKHIGNFSDVLDAQKAYADAKESYVKKVAMEWRDSIDPRVFNYLMSWTVPNKWVRD